MISLITTWKDYIPITDIPKSDERSTKIRDLIISKTANILHMFLPILTSRVYVIYEKNLKKELASSTLAASIVCTKESQLSKKVSEIIDNEKSVKAPQMNDIVSSKV